MIPSGASMAGGLRKPLIYGLQDVMAPRQYYQYV